MILIKHYETLQLLQLHPPHSISFQTIRRSKADILKHPQRAERAFSGFSNVLTDQGVVSLNLSNNQEFITQEASERPPCLK